MTHDFSIPVLNGFNSLCKRIAIGTNIGNKSEQNINQAETMDLIEWVRSTKRV
jgi:hypothetical protein